MGILISEVRNAQSMNASNTVIDVEINHPQYGWIPYLLTDYDTDTTIDNDAVLALIGNDFAAYVPPTQAELDLQAAASVRAERDRKLSQDVDPIVTNPLRWAEISAAKQADWTAYRTDLLDITGQAGFPHSVVWPVKPE